MLCAASSPPTFLPIESTFLKESLFSFSQQSIRLRVHGVLSSRQSRCGIPSRRSRSRSRRGLQRLLFQSRSGTLDDSNWYVLNANRKQIMEKQNKKSTEYIPPLCSVAAMAAISNVFGRVVSNRLFSFLFLSFRVIYCSCFTPFGGVPAGRQIQRDESARSRFVPAAVFFRLDGQ